MGKTKNMSIDQKTILGVIICAIVLVIGATTYALIFTPERRAKNKLAILAKDYYENYIYQDISDFNGGGDISNILQKYTDSGFSTLTLRQVALHNSEKTTADYDYLKKYCDENNTLIKIYPVAPFNRTSYRVDYTYACDF